MELRQLKYFLAICQHGSISKAAQKLYVTQPNITRQIQSLEQELGQQLLVRGTKQIVLTQAGKLLQKRAQEISQLVDATLQELSSSIQNPCGCITIGGGESYAVELIAQTAKQLNAQYPKIRFEFHSGDTLDVTEKIDKGLLDFGILIEPNDLKKYDYIQLPYEDTWGVLMRKDSVLANKQQITTADLNDLPLILSKHSVAQNIVSKWAKDTAEFNIVATYNLIYNASLMVKQGLGYAIGLDRLINTTDTELCFRPLSPAVHSKLYVVWKNNVVLSDLAKLFVNTLNEVIEQSGN